MPTKTYSEYCRILGVDEGASLTDIKKAYRRKATQLHPDVNPAADAHAQFVLLVEAYQYISDVKNGKIRRNASQTTYTYAYNDTRWQDTAREEARERARKYARMRYEQFTSVREYPRPMFDFMAHVFFFFYILLLLLMPLILIHYFGTTDGFIGTLLTWALTAPITVGTWKYRPRLEMRKFMAGLGEIMSSGYFFGTVFLLFNGAMLITVDMITMITPNALGLALLSSLAASLTLGGMLHKRRRRRKEGRSRIIFNTLFAGPALVHFLLLINFLFCHSPVKEAYHFRYEWKKGENQSRFSRYIQLDYGHYDEYPTLRTFSDQHRILDNRHIVYTFHRGLLGIPVMTDYAFLP